MAGTDIASVYVLKVRNCLSADIKFPIIYWEFSKSLPLLMVAKFAGQNGVDR